MDPTSLGRNLFMDMTTTMMILFGSLISVTTALTYMEVRRMRKGSR